MQRTREDLQTTDKFNKEIHRGMKIQLDLTFINNRLVLTPRDRRRKSNITRTRSKIRTSMKTRIKKILSDQPEDETVMRMDGRLTRVLCRLCDSATNKQH